MAHKTIVTALLAAHKHMKNAQKNSRSHHGAYSNFEDVLDAVRQPLLTEGILITQVMDVINYGTDETPAIKNVLVTKLMHESGETLEATVIIPDNANIQQWGSNQTYQKRYSLQALLGIASEESDGNDVVTGKPPSKAGAAPKAATNRFNKAK